MLKLAEGVDILPMLMSVQRQAEGVFGEKDTVSLFLGDWTGEYYAFPQIRGLLLDLLRRVEAGTVHEVALIKVGEKYGLDPLPDSSRAICVTALGPWSLGMICGKSQLTISPGTIVFCTNSEELLMTGVEGETFALVVVYSPMP